jgi:hypothetical protein
MKEYGKEKLKTKLEGIVQSMITQLDSKEKKTKNDTDQTTSLNYAIYDYKGIEYDDKSVLNYIKEKRVPKGGWERWWNLISSLWIVYSCEFSFLISFLIYGNNNNISQWKYFPVIGIFILSLALYLFIQRYLKSKEILFRECVNANIIMKFDKYHWVKYGLLLAVLVLIIFIIVLVDQANDFGSFYISIVSPFVGIAGAFIANVVGFSDSVYSLHDYIEDLGDGIINQCITIIPERIFILI